VSINVVCWVFKIAIIHLPTHFKGGPEPSEKLIRKVLVPIGRFHFYLFQYQNKADRIILPGTFRGLDEVCSEVTEDSRVLKVRSLWFPTSDRLQIWLIPSGTPPKNGEIALLLATNLGVKYVLHKRIESNNNYQ